MVFSLFMGVFLLIPNFLGGELAKLGSLFAFSPSSVLGILLCFAWTWDANPAFVKRLAGHHFVETSWALCTFCFGLLQRYGVRKKFISSIYSFCLSPLLLPSKHLPVFFFFQLKFVWNFWKISTKVTKMKGNFQMIKTSLCRFCLCL